MATDLAEFLGAAIGMHILFGMALLPAALLTAVISFALLAVQRPGHVPFEMAIMAFVAVIGAAFVVEIFVSNPDPAAALKGLVDPAPRRRARSTSRSAWSVRRSCPTSSTCTPGLVQHRNRILDGHSRREHFKRELVDIALAMNGAFLINASMVIMAAAVFFANGIDVTGIEDAHQTLGPLLGQLAPAAFGIALLASGLSSSTVGHDGRSDDRRRVHGLEGAHLLPPPADDDPGADRDRPWRQHAVHADSAAR